ncbi:MAG TPA: hypothetical protein VHT03_08505 [Rhizomicrobium sp.]|jgi:hypothetical protein|nr:hypothetical protein [Rhizomicrobium sp.]
MRCYQFLHERVFPAPPAFHPRRTPVSLLRTAAELAEAQQLTVDNRYSSIARLMASQYICVPKIRGRFENNFLLGLRRAELPEE